MSERLSRHTDPSLEPLPDDDDERIEGTLPRLLFALFAVLMMVGLAGLLYGVWRY